jgi:hypothetical protein
MLSSVPRHIVIHSFHLLLVSLLSPADPTCRIRALTSGIDTEAAQPGTLGQKRGSRPQSALGHNAISWGTTPIIRRTACGSSRMLWSNSIASSDDGRRSVATKGVNSILPGAVKPEQTEVAKQTLPPVRA